MSSTQKIFQTTGTEVKAAPKLEDKEAKSGKYQRIFKTKTRSDKDYPFTALSKDFHSKEQVKLVDEADYHSATTLLDHSGNKWFLITNTTINKSCIERQSAFAMLGAEIYRAEIGPNAHPKEKILRDAPKTQFCRLSKAVENYHEFHDFFNANLFEKEKKNSFEPEDYYENTGRIVFNKRLYQENDFNFQNMWVDPINKILGVIDPCQSFGPLTHALLKRQYSYRKVNYSLAKHHQVAKKKCIEPDPINSIWSIPGKKSDYMGEYNPKDYKTLPNIKYMIALSWDFNNAVNYSEAIKNTYRFQNEKHFSALKSSITFQLKHELIEIHIADEKDRQATHTQFEQYEQNTFQDIQSSSTFKLYLNRYRLDALKTIFYEELEFLIAGEHYFSKDPEIAAQEWNLFQTQIIQAFAGLLRKLDLKELRLEEQKSLHQFAENLWKKDESALSEILLFYKEQEMPYHEASVKKETARPSKEGLFGKDIKPVETKPMEQAKELGCVIL